MADIFCNSLDFVVPATPLHPCAHVDFLTWFAAMKMREVPVNTLAFYAGSTQYSSKLILHSCVLSFALYFALLYLQTCFQLLCNLIDSAIFTSLKHTYDFNQIVKKRVSRRIEWDNVLVICTSSLSNTVAAPALLLPNLRFW